MLFIVVYKICCMSSSEWELMSCDWCGSQATHLKCSNLLTMLDDWLCKECISIKMKGSYVGVLFPLCCK